MDLAAWGFAAPKTHFVAEDVPDLNGKVVIVTGANASCRAAEIGAREVHSPYALP